MADRLEQGGGDGFLSRWSRLKSQQDDLAGLQTGELVEDRLSQDLDRDFGVAVESSQNHSELDLEPEPLTDADMPDIETLDEHSNFSGFLSEKVSEHLRRKALKKLFHLPEFNIRDGLNEYDEDYSTFIPLGDTVTYQMRQFIERQKQQFNEALADQNTGEHESAQAAVDPRDEVEDCRLAQSKRADPVELVDEIDADPLDEDDLGECE